MEVDWYTVCDEKNILLEKNDDNMYKLTFDIYEDNENEFSVIDILKNDQLFDLLYELNKDLIESVDVSEKNNIKSVVIKIININNEYNKDEKKTVHLNFAYTFQKNKCEIDSIIHIVKKDEDNPDNVYISTFNMSFAEEGKITRVLLTFNVDDVVDNNLAQMYLGLYFKKILYRLKLYFE
jgi:hypothetical protein